MDIECPVCHRTFHLPQKWQYHSGFGNQGFLYCDSCPNIVVFSSYDSRYMEIIGKGTHPWALSESGQRLVESNLKPCPCGGHFLFTAAPRCPLCNAPIREILLGSIYYVKTGRVYDGNKDEIWIAG